MKGSSRGLLCVVVSHTPRELLGSKEACKAAVYMLYILYWYDCWTKRDSPCCETEDGTLLESNYIGRFLLSKRPNSLFGDAN